MDTGDIAIITVQTLGAYRKNIATLPRKIELYMDWSIDVEQIKATSNQFATRNNRKGNNQN